MATDLEDYSLARVIKGIYDGDYYTVATDEDGNIIGVFKGEYNEELITIKTDSSGRMLAIITDPEDVYGNIHMVGNAELAARLGSIHSFDRRGNILLLDDFEAGILRWDNDGAGDNHTETVNAGAAKSGTQSCKLTAGEGAGGQSWIYKYLGVPVSGKIGAEFSFTIDDDTTTITVDFRWLDGAKYYKAYIKYEKAQDRFRYLDKDNAWQDLFTNFKLVASSKTFHTMKIVIDTGLLEQVRFMLDNQTKDTSGVALRPDTDTTAASIYLGINHTSAHADVKSIYVDNIIITQNEP